VIGRMIDQVTAEVFFASTSSSFVGMNDEGDPWPNQYTRETDNGNGPEQLVSMG
jgi:hypothetical protein